MSFLTLIDTDSALFATDQWVYDSSEAGAFFNLMDRADAWTRLLRQQKEKVKSAKEEARAKGYRDGLEAGKREARSKLTTAMLTSQRAEIQGRKQMRVDSIQLALEIVRRLGLATPAPELICALATTAASELHADETAQLLVHPSVHHEVSRRIAVFDDMRDRNNALSQSIVSAVADDTLAEHECILRTRFGTLHAGLDSQLAVVEESLKGAADGS